jgi:hypothetical protein
MNVEPCQFCRAHRADQDALIEPWLRYECSLCGAPRHATSPQQRALTTRIGTIAAPIPSDAIPGSER